MPGEPPDPLAIATKLRDIRTALDEQRVRIADLVNANPSNTDYRVAYARATIAMSEIDGAIVVLDLLR
jgi:hypothetical protein